MDSNDKNQNNQNKFNYKKVVNFIYLLILFYSPIMTMGIINSIYVNKDIVRYSGLEVSIPNYGFFFLFFFALFIIPYIIMYFFSRSISFAVDFSSNRRFLLANFIPSFILGMILIANVH